MKNYWNPKAKLEEAINETFVLPMKTKLFPRFLRSASKLEIKFTPKIPQLDIPLINLKLKYEVLFDNYFAVFSSRMKIAYSIIVLLEYFNKK